MGKYLNPNVLDGGMVFDMKEMLYGKDRKIEVLDMGEFFGFTYYIMNLGTHPTAYIQIPENHKFYNKNHDEIDLNVHGGLTYSENHLCLSKIAKVDGWFIGWDYAHSGDYIGGYEILFPYKFEINEKKWTTEEIKQEVMNACKELLELEKE